MYASYLHLSSTPLFFFFSLPKETQIEFFRRSSQFKAIFFPFVRWSLFLHSFRRHLSLFPRCCGNSPRKVDVCILESSLKDTLWSLIWLVNSNDRTKTNFLCAYIKRTGIVLPYITWTKRYCHTAIYQLVLPTWGQLPSIAVPLVALSGPLVLGIKCVLSNWLPHTGSMHIHCIVAEISGSPIMWRLSLLIRKSWQCSPKPPVLLRSAHTGSTPKDNTTAHQSLRGLEKLPWCSMDPPTPGSCCLCYALMMLNGRSPQFLEDATCMVQHMQFSTKWLIISAHAMAL